MSASPLDATWIGHTPAGVTIARGGPDGTVLVDLPMQRRFRVPYPAEFHHGVPTVDGSVLMPVLDVRTTMDGVAGWYESAARRVLLTRFPEPYFGEPMMLVAEGDQVMRAYPVAADRMIADDGTVIECVDGRLRLHVNATTVELPRSRRFREESVTFRVGDAELAGTVILPTTPGPHPAAVVVHGAAGGQRDFCRLHAQPLLEAGVAVLIYDKAGHGRSDGAADPSIFDQADAAEAGLALLAARSDIDIRRVGLVGLSNGMWAVPMVAARQLVAFIAGVGSPGVSMAESEVHRRTKVLRDCGVGETTVQAVSDAWRCVFAIVGSGVADTTTVDLLDRALARIGQADDLDRYVVPDYVRRNPMLSSLPPPMSAAELAEMLVAEADPQVSYDPAVDYARSACPVFLQYGADDTSVPVTASVRAVEQAAGERAVILVYPGLEHLLNVVPTLAGLSVEESMYQFHSFQFGPGVWRDLTDWLRVLLFG
jgi:pimeloyl-ACP methyl ester carboxylesterase